MSDSTTDGLTRRHLFQIGGVGVAMATVAAACGSSKKGSTTATAGASTTTTTTVSQSDITWLRTLTSIEEAAVAAYQKVIDASTALGLPSSVSTSVAAFQKHHKDHANLLAKATTDAGGTPFTTANPVVMGQLDPGLSSMKTATDALDVLYGMEKAIAATYQSSVGSFSKKSYNQSVMAVGGAEAKHATMLAAALGLNDKLITNGAFQATTGAVSSGTGIS